MTNPIDILKRWASTKQRVFALKRKVGDSLCDFELDWMEPPEDSIRLNGGFTEPCWKGSYVETGQGHFEPDCEWEYTRPKEEWCEPCIHREEARRRLHNEQKRLAALQGAMYRAGLSQEKDVL